ncbi:hypothetical protein [Faecalibacter macacae]|uniref:Uncharacterized protein n=1 Tax=Faecalibacter macacae TaxID=1859289 RepID=A0A3L9MGK5_9FLAO|nr:hypothetical protein [Faecalibacter macacae]RLZ09699.1 hypothetical protein EAH69_07890 [Faecalibacter macacae]
MKFLFFIKLFLTSYLLTAQIQKEYYITIKNDTISGEFLDYHPKMVTFLVDEIKVKLKPKEIQSIFIKENEKLVKYVTLNNDKTNFYEEAVVGPLSLYYLRTFNPYDGEKLIFSILIKNNEMINVNASNSKKRIAKLIKDCPQLLKEWTQTNNYPDYDIIKITEAYNECKK